MEPGAINSFLDQFIAFADSGFGLIRGDIGFVLNALIAISITLAGAQWALAQEAPVAPFFRKVLFIGLFAFLINNWEWVTTAINQSGALLGIRAGGSSLTLADLHNPGRMASIGTELFGRTAAMTEGMNFMFETGTYITIYAAAFAIMLGFFVLALQVFIALIAFKLGSLAAFIALPWGIFSGTAWVAERPLGWVAGCAVRLFVLGFIASMAMTFVDTLPAMLTADGGGALNIMLFGLTVLALSWFGPMLASEVVQGQPHLSTSDVAMTAVGSTLVTSHVVGGALGVGGNTVEGGGRARGWAAGRVGGGGGGGRGGGGSGGGGAGRGGSGGAINYNNMRPRPAPPAQAGGANP